MAEYAYMSGAGKVKSFLDKIQEVRIPEKVTQNWLQSMGFTSTNDRQLTPIAKQVGLIDPAGKPTSIWEKFRAGDKKALADGIRSGYPALYNLYPNAHVRSQSELENAIRGSATNLGKDAVSRALATFRALCAEADFSEVEDVPTSSGVSSNGAVAPTPVQIQPIPTAGNSGLTVNLNVQLTLPETNDAEVYSKLFAAMREHLLRDPNHA